MEIPSLPWIELPKDLTANIVGRLDVVEILESVQKVCTTWWKVCKDHPSVWRAITMKKVGGPMHRHLPTMFRHAVDRSQGQLIELNLLGDYELLNYAVDRSSKLRSLKLDNCIEIGIKSLTEAVKKLPHLEELHLTRMPFLTPGDIDIIGVSCPMLKSATFDRPVSFDYYDDYNLALAIAKTMPNLRHLRRPGHYWMTNDGLEAILDGCPHLESLGLSDCIGLDIDGDLGRRCCEQIKYLRSPWNTVITREDPDSIPIGNEFWSSWSFWVLTTNISR